MSKQETENTEEVTQSSEVSSPEEMTAEVGKVLKRVGNVIFTLPASIKTQRGIYNEKAQEPLLKMKALQKAISSNTKLIFTEGTDDDSLASLAKVVRDSKASKMLHKEEADKLGADQLARIQELNDEAKADKDQLALDFASELISGLVK